MWYNERRFKDNKGKGKKEMKIPLHKGEHRGGVPHKGAYYIGCGGAAQHLVYGFQYEPYKECDPYDFKWDSDRAGALVWFDTKYDAVVFANGSRRKLGDIVALPIAGSPQLVETISYRDKEMYDVWGDYLEESGRIVEL